MSCVRLIGVLAVLWAGWLCLAAGNGWAATAGIVEACNKDQGCHSTLLYTAGATEQLNARLSSDRDGSVTIAEAGAAISTAAGCSLSAPGTVRCAPPVADNASIWDVIVTGGQRGNRIDASAMHAPQAGAQVELHGGAGDDTLIGGDGLNILSPGYGHDTVDGGRGQSEISFAGLHGRLYVNLGRQTAIGTGVKDTLAHIENVVGNDGNDTLIGDKQANSIYGGAGTDLIEGGGGDDALGSSGPARIIAGPGHSKLGVRGEPTSGEPNGFTFEPSSADSGPASAVFICNSAGDVVSNTGPNNVIGSRCHTAEFALLLTPVTMLLNARDPRQDYVRIPLDQTAGHFTLIADLRAQNGMTLASVRLRADDEPQNPTRFTTLRLTAPAARYVATHRPLRATLFVGVAGQSGQRTALVIS